MQGIFNVTWTTVSIAVDSQVWACSYVYDLKHMEPASEELCATLDPIL